MILQVPLVLFFAMSVFRYSYSAVVFAATDNITASLGVSQQNHTLIALVWLKSTRSFRSFANIFFTKGY